MPIEQLLSDFVSALNRTTAALQSNTEALEAIRATGSEAPKRGPGRPPKADATDAPDIETVRKAARAFADAGDEQQRANIIRECLAKFKVEKIPQLPENRRQPFLDLLKEKEQLLATMEGEEEVAEEEGESWA